ncbi:MAG: YlmC/YmxH family sporulation protein [Firmicutes bacterium]|jgi:YlmC/YmxH family sporulation protein|nr:YlmC/YmxH family sporulation protein [Bacillota bacterium]
MRYSELIGKEIVDVSAGTRLGLVAGTDLVIDTLTGSLEALVVFRRSGWFSVHEITVPWHGVKKVGKDMIIVDISAAAEPLPSRSTVSQMPKRTRHFVPGVTADGDDSDEATATSLPVDTDEQEPDSESVESSTSKNKRVFLRRRES